MEPRCVADDKLAGRALGGGTHSLSTWDRHAGNRRRQGKCSSYTAPLFLAASAGRPADAACDRHRCGGHRRIHGVVVQRRRLSVARRCAPAGARDGAQPCADCRTRHRTQLRTLFALAAGGHRRPQRSRNHDGVAACPAASAVRPIRHGQLPGLDSRARRDRAGQIGFAERRPSPHEFRRPALFHGSARSPRCRPVR